MLTENPVPLARHEAMVGGYVRCSCVTTVVSTSHDDVVVLRVAGEVDVATLPVLQSGLTEAFARYPAHLVVELAGVTFCSVRALVVLIEARTIAGVYGTTYALSGVPSWADRVWPLLCPLDDLPRRHPTAEAAVRAAEGASPRIR